MKKSIVVSGLGMVGALGSDRERILAALSGGSHGLGQSDAYGPARWLGQVRDFDQDRFVEKKKARRMEASNIYSLAAAQLAPTADLMAATT